jgi:hypothetical protein
MNDTLYYTKKRLREVRNMHQKNADFFHGGDVWTSVAANAIQRDLDALEGFRRGDRTSPLRGRAIRILSTAEVDLEDLHAARMCAAHGVERMRGVRADMALGIMSPQGLAIDYRRARSFLIWSRKNLSRVERRIYPRPRRVIQRA